MDDGQNKTVVQGVRSIETDIVQDLELMDRLPAELRIAVKSYPYKVSSTDVMNYYCMVRDHPEVVREFPDPARRDTYAIACTVKVIGESAAKALNQAYQEIGFQPDPKMFKQI